MRYRDIAGRRKTADEPRAARACGGRQDNWNNRASSGTCGSRQRCPDAATKRAGRARVCTARVATSLKEAPISIEVELKLAAGPADLPELTRALAAMAPDAAPLTRRLVTTYFDTPDRALTKSRAALRVREEDGGFVQNLKTADPEGASLLARGEWESAVAGNRPEPHTAEIALHLPGGVNGELHPLFVTEFTRTTIEIEPEPGTRIEAAIDHGAVRVPNSNRVDPISEVELELKSGASIALYDLARKLLDTAALRIDPESKAERGYRLLAGDATPPVVMAEPIRLDPEMRVEDALSRIGRGCLAHLLRNEGPALAGEAEGVHQMRVAIRRLRSLLAALKAAVPEAERRWAMGELAALNRSLGPARNLDVFAAELLPPARREFPDEPGWDELAAAADAARAAAYQRVRETLGAPQHTAAMLGLLRWFERPGRQRVADDEEMAAPGAKIGEMAPGVLDRRRRALQKRSRGFRRLSASGRHRVRIAAKKLRYAVELLDSLYDSRVARRWIKRSKRVQDELGHANDVRTAYDLVIELGRTAAEAEPLAAAGAHLLAQHERRLARQEKKLRRRLRRLIRTRPFWR